MRGGKQSGACPSAPASLSAALGAWTDVMSLSRNIGKEKLSCDGGGLGGACGRGGGVVVSGGAGKCGGDGYAVCCLSCLLITAWW